MLDPTESVLQVGNFELAAQGMATTTLRSVIGGIPLDDVLSEREHINKMLRTRLDEVTERWGVKVTNVEIREIIPPREVQDAMNRQMSAERIRRAVVTEFDRYARSRHQRGRRREAVRHPARRRREASPTSCGPKARSRRSCCAPKVFRPRWSASSAVAKTIDQKTMTLQYFETLKSIGASPSTKYIFPMEFTSMLVQFRPGTG